MSLPAGSLLHLYTSQSKGSCAPELLPAQGRQGASARRPFNLCVCEAEAGGSLWGLHPALLPAWGLHPAPQMETIVLGCFCPLLVLWISDPPLPLLPFLMPTPGHCRLQNTLWLCFDDDDEGHTSCLVTHGIQAGTCLPSIRSSFRPLVLNYWAIPQLSFLPLGYLTAVPYIQS